MRRINDQAHDDAYTRLVVLSTFKNFVNLEHVKMGDASDAGLRDLSGLSALKSLNLDGSDKLTAAG